MEQLLNKPKGAKEAADQPPQTEAQQHQDPHNIQRQLIGHGAQGVLQRAQWTGGYRPGAGVAVEPRHADGLALSPVNLPLQQIGQVRICQQRGTCLRKSPKPGEKAGNGWSLRVLFLLIQYINHRNQYDSTKYTSGTVKCERTNIVHPSTLCNKCSSPNERDYQKY